MSAGGPLVLGLMLGLRHAAEPDHLAAIANLMGPERGARSAALTGALWGFGHGAAIVLVGGALAITGVRMPASLAVALDLAVVLMLIVLGTLSLRRARPEAAHGHTHGAASDHASAPVRTAAQSALVGFIHGASGTAGLTVLYVAKLPTVGRALAFLCVFSLGALAAMAALSGMLAAPLSAIRHRRANLIGRIRIAGAAVAFAAAGLVLFDMLRGG